MKLLFSLTFFLFLATALIAQQPGLVNFSLEDQFGAQHQRNDYSYKILVVIAGDKGGSTYNEQWGQAIADSISGHPHISQMQILPIADLGIVPSFLRGLVKMMLPENPKEMVLLDWDGLFASTYGLTADATNILVFDTKGTLCLQENGQDLEQGKLQQIKSTITSLLEQN